MKKAVMKKVAMKKAACFVWNQVLARQAAFS